ncbi:type II toxin-antitoxin system PemK/MazF family toxin [Streptomyces sp. NPDC059897]|uniref:type II toxin-antitoxin system PemK/MazF family toxin n=1 Tax=Streptomyces sp. NPDC059897 TaxID=3346994 RepID=UPI00364AB9D9
MRRGDIYLADLDPVRGSEANKVRPVILVTNDAANRMAERAGRGVLTVVPLTSNVTHVWPFQVLLDADECGLRQASKAQCEQIRAADVSRIGKHIGSVPPQAMRAIDTALRRQLAI